MQDGGHALVSARTIRWLVSTSEPNGRIQAQQSFGRLFQVDDAVEANLFSKEATINPKEERGRRSLSSQGTVFDIDCARSRDATDNWPWMSSRTLYLSIALPLNMVGGDLDSDITADNQ